MDNNLIKTVDIHDDLQKTYLILSHLELEYKMISKSWIYIYKSKLSRSLVYLPDVLDLRYVPSIFYNPDLLIDSS